MSNLLLLNARMDIGLKGIQIHFNAVDDDLAKLLEQVESFKVEGIKRHALGTSDVSLISNKGLGFIERPELEEDEGTPPNTGGPCGCDDPSKPLVPIEVPESKFSDIRLLTEDEYNNLTQLVDKPTYDELGVFTLTKLSEGVYGVTGGFNHLYGYDSLEEGAHMFLTLSVDDYVKSYLGVMNVENPDKVVMTLSSYGRLTNFTAKQMYLGINPITNSFIMPIMVGIKGLTAIPDVVIKADWDGGGSQKFAKYTTTIKMDTAIILDGTPPVPTPH